MSNPLIVILLMSGVVKFSNPMYSPKAVSAVLNQIAGLAFHGSMIVEYRGGRVSNVSYSANSESEVMNIARAFIRTNMDIVCVRIPRFNVVMYLSLIVLPYSFALVMVSLNVPVPVCDFPERVHGASAVFEVVYRNGVSREFFGVIHSVSGLFDSMVTRLYHDASIMYIGVSLKSGRFVCEAYLD